MAREIPKKTELCPSTAVCSFLGLNKSNFTQTGSYDFPRSPPDPQTLQTCFKNMFLCFLACRVGWGHASFGTAGTIIVELIPSCPIEALGASLKPRSHRQLWVAQKPQKLQKNCKIKFVTKTVCFTIHIEIGEV